MQVSPIDQMPTLVARLGRARTERIRYLSRSNSSRQPRSQNIENTVLSYMQFRQPHDDNCPVDDIIQGIARLDHQMTTGVSKPLSVTRMYNILQCMPLINTREVMAMLDVEVRQAQKYVKACKLALFHINRHIKTQQL